jgi:hypothetical protein
MVRTRSTETKPLQVDGNMTHKKNRGRNNKTLHENVVIEEDFSDDEYDVKHRVNLKSVRKGSSTGVRRVVTENHSSSDGEANLNGENSDDKKCIVMGDKRASDYFASRKFRMYLRPHS